MFQHHAVPVVWGHARITGMRVATKDFVQMWDKTCCSEIVKRSATTIAIIDPTKSAATVWARLKRNIDSSETTWPISRLLL